MLCKHTKHIQNTQNDIINTSTILYLSTIVNIVIFCGLCLSTVAGLVLNIIFIEISFKTTHALTVENA